MKPVQKDSARPLRVLSLFSGGGGLDIGFAKAGFSVVCSSDIVPDFCKTLEMNTLTFGDHHRVLCEDVATFEPGAHNLGEIDFVIGGPPCQSFSAAGRRAGGVFGLNDLRGSLFWHYCRILKEVQPRGFLFENVRGILSANNNLAWKVIVESFAELGFKLHFRVVDAAEYGVPQHRDRVILVGTKGISNFSFPRPTHGPTTQGKVPYVSASEAIADLQNPKERYIPYGGKYEALLNEVPPGSNYLFFTEKMHHPAPKFAWRSRFSDFLYVADPDRPTRTIVAQPGKWAGPFHWKRRKFTIAELKRLFTFPDDYCLTGRELVQIKQLGNSVAPRLGYQLALAVRQQLFGVHSGVELVTDDFHFDLDKRKARRAKTTKSKVRTNKELFSFSQLDLFEKQEETSDVRIDDSYEVWYNDWRVQCIDKQFALPNAQCFSCTALLKDGIWDVQIVAPKGVSVIELELKFIKLIQGKFNTIKVTFSTPHPNWIGVAWDAINRCVQKSTSYENLHKLYGHFTEPYPQFAMEFRANKSRSPLFKFQKQLADYSYLAGYHALEDLRSYWNTTASPIVHAKKLREIGFDIRTHETNRTVPEGMFRVCYPFTIATNSKNFVTWREKGTHRTADRTSIPEGEL